MADRIDNLGDKKHKLTADDASKGGKKSGQVRRDKRDIKELAKADRRSTEGVASLGRSNAIPFYSGRRMILDIKTTPCI